MAADKHSDLPASERHLGWAISAVMNGAMVRLRNWDKGAHWALGANGKVCAFNGSGEQTVRLDLNPFSDLKGFYIYEPEPESDLPTPTYGERIVSLEAECRALRELVRGEFAALSARITEVSRLVQDNVESLRRAVSSTELSAQDAHRVAMDNRKNLEKTGGIMYSRIGELGDRVKTLENGPTPFGVWEVEGE